jgi:hypothetical protein
MNSTPETQKKVLPLDQIYLSWATRYLTTPMGEHWEYVSSVLNSFTVTEARLLLYVVC